MANQKTIAEVPRLLLPRIAASQVTAKGAASQLGPKIRSNHDRSVPLQLYRFQQTRTLHTALPPRHPFFAYLRSVTSHQTAKKPCPTSVDAPPIRHNGVYVATFKPAKRAFSITRPQQKHHHFDTLKFVQRLKGEGFSEEQAAAMMRVLNDVIEESIQNLTRTMVLKEGNHCQTSRFSKQHLG